MGDPSPLPLLQTETKYGSTKKKKPGIYFADMLLVVVEGGMSNFVTQSTA
jgi:hypothetical protein